jgi:hypothetical protein
VETEKVATKSQATRLVDLALESGLDLWHTPAGLQYVSIVVDGHREHFPIHSRAMKDHLARLYFDAGRSAPNASAVNDALAVLAGIARYEGAEHETWLRLARQGDLLHLDLGDSDWRAVQITRDEWRIVERPPVRFRRPKGLLPLPVPIPGGNLGDLCAFVNITSEDFPLYAAWLLSAFSGGPFPVLVLLGEQGSAKSTVSRVSRRLIDPNASDVRSTPREIRDLAIAAENSYILAFDNLSTISDWLSDGLCRLATGGGFSTRTLYENREEEIFDARRPVILNGITSIVSRPDLVDRAITLTCPVISEHARRDEESFWREFDAVRPQVLGALLDCVVMALQRRSAVTLPAKPRMADFAKWVVAAEPACPWEPGTFLAAYSDNRQGAVEAVLEGDPVVDTIRTVTATGTWEGTASELLTELNARTPEAVRKEKGWYRRPREVADTVRRLAPALRKTGTDVAFRRAAHTRQRLITFTPVRVADSSSPSSPSSPSPDSRPAIGDAPGTHGDVAGESSSPDFGLEDARDAEDAAIPVFEGEVPDGY